MKLFVPVVVTLVVGIVVGSWQPRGELLALRSEVDELRAQVRRPCRSTGAGTLGGILRVRPEAPTPERNGENAPSRVPDATTPSPGGGEVVTEADPPGETPEEAIAAMRAALSARRAQALQALTEQGGLSDPQVDEVETIMADMNTELKRAVDTMVDDALAAGEVDRRDMLEFGADALDIVLAADDRMRSALPAEVYAAVDDASVDPLSFVSADAIESATRLQGLPGFEP